MERFADQPLGSAPHIAVLSSDKVGNFVVSTPLLRGLRAKYPDATLDLLGSDTNEALERACPWIDHRWSLYGPPEELARVATFRAAREAAAGPYALAINLDGFNPWGRRAAGRLGARYVVGEAEDPASGRRLPTGDLPQHRLVAEPDWDDPRLIERYGAVLGSNYIAEIFCAIAFVTDDPFRLEVGRTPPDFDVPDVLLHVTTTRTAKMWPLPGWREVARWCREQGLSAGLVGAAPDRQRELYNAGSSEDVLVEREGVLDLRGRTTLTELAGALAQTRGLVTVDAGPLHIAAAVGCPTLALFGNDPWDVGASPLRLWAPRVPWVRILRSRATCDVCRNNHYRNSACLVAGHPCMTGLNATAVITELEATLAQTSPRGPRP